MFPLCSKSHIQSRTTSCVTELLKMKLSVLSHWFLNICFRLEVCPWCWSLPGIIPIYECDMNACWISNSWHGSHQWADEMYWSLHILIPLGTQHLGMAVIKVQLCPQSPPLALLKNDMLKKELRVFCVIVLNLKESELTGIRCVAGRMFFKSKGTWSNIKSKEGKAQCHLFFFPSEWSKTYYEM